jgi:glycosyltransferase involved in cell wall biosynthesis
MKQPRITVSIPCFGRPERTKRAIEAIMAQDTNGWEAFIMGDNCPDFQKLIDSKYLEDCRFNAARHGNIINYIQSPRNFGGCGYNLTNYAIKHCTGKYLIFYANDDVILPNHFSNYLEIESTDLDYMYFNSYLAPLKQTRIPQLSGGKIGHSEIIVKSTLAKKLKPHKPVYGHDWDFIHEMIGKGRGKRANSMTTTYHVMHIPNFGTVDIID